MRRTRQTINKFVKILGKTYLTWYRHLVPCANFVHRVAVSSPGGLLTRNHRPVVGAGSSTSVLLELTNN